MNKKALAIAMILLAGQAVSAACGTVKSATARIVLMLNTLGLPIALFMMLYMGIKWIIAEGPEERENARRGIIYVVIGILLLRSSADLVAYLLC